MIRTRFAPSPTGYMHIGNLRSALYTYLVAKSEGGTFILRIEDTDKNRQVDDATDIIYKTLEIAGLTYDEGPNVGGDFGPYIQSERKSNYIKYAKQLVDDGFAYYCFCTKERLESLDSYDNHCRSLSSDLIEENLKNNVPYVIRQLIPDGYTNFKDQVYGKISVDNKELDDQVLIKADGFPTYNFANVVDDHLMEISHIVRGSEYLSSTPKYILLYKALNFPIPAFIHLPLIQGEDGQKLSKRRGDASFQDLIDQGYLPDAIINYIALLGFSPSNNKEIFNLNELTEIFNVKGLNKSPATFDTKKLMWVNTEYFKKMSEDDFFLLSEKILADNIKRPNIDLKYVSSLVKSRVTFIKDIPSLVDFIDNTFHYEKDLFVHKKMKTNEENSLTSLQNILPIIESIEDWSLDNIHDTVFSFIKTLEIKNGVMLWPLRTALSTKPTSPCGAIDLFILLGKNESIKRIKHAINLLSN